MKKRVIAVALVLLIISFCVLFILNKKDNSKDKGNHLIISDVLQVNDDIISLQKAADEKILAASKNENYTFEDPYILQNPYSISPLTAVVSFTTKDKVSVKVNVNDIEYVVEETTNHIIPIYGLKAFEKNSVMLTINDKTKSIELNIIDIENTPVFDVKTNKMDNENNGIYVLAEATHVYGYNNDGSLVWLLNGIHGARFKELNNGHFLVYSILGGSVNISYPIIYEVDYLGKIYNSYKIDTGVYSISTLKDENHLLFITNKVNSEMEHDVVAELDLNTGKIVKRTVISELLRSIDNFEVSEDLRFLWSEIDSIYYDSKNDSVILSMTRMNSIISINYLTGNINWIFGDKNNWPSGFNKYMVNSEFTPFSSTIISVNNNGYFTLFYNGYNNKLLNDECSKYINSYSKAMIIDIIDKKSKLISEFNDNKSFFSYAVSNYYELENGNYLLDSGWELDKKEFNNDGCTLNELTSQINSSIYELDKNNNVLFKANANIGSYAGYKLFFSNKLDNYSIVDVTQFVNSDNFMFKQIDFNDIKEEIDNAKDYNLSLDVSKNYISVNQMYFDDDEASLLFISETGDVYESIIVNDDFFNLNISLNGLKGKYALYYKLNNEYYNLNTSYEF